MTSTRAARSQRDTGHRSTITLATAAAPAQNLMMFTSDYNAFVNAYSYAGNFVQVVSRHVSFYYSQYSFPCHSAS